MIKRISKSLTLIGLAIVLLVSIGIAGGCTSQEPAEGTIEITDMAGRAVSVPQDVDEIVGIEAGALRLITYLDAVDKVVGVEEVEKSGSPHAVRKEPVFMTYNLAHPELAKLPSIGPIHGGDAELIVAQHPDVIFWTYAAAGNANNLQKKTGIPVVVIDYVSPNTEEQRATLYEALRLMGKVLGKEERAEELVRYMEGVIQDLNDRTEDIPEGKRPKVYLGGIGFKGAHGIISTDPAYAPFQFVNAKNVAGDMPLEHAMVSHAMVSREKILEWNPEVLFVDEVGSLLVMKDLKGKEYQVLDAIKNDKIYGVLPFNFYATNYTTVLADAYYIGEILYPEKFNDIDAEKKADEIYKKFLGKSIYKEMKEEFGGFKKIKLK